MSGGQLTALPDLLAFRVLEGSGAHNGPVSIAEGLPLCGKCNLVRPTIAKCALVAHVFIRPNWGGGVIDPSDQEFSTGAAFVIGMPQRFSHKEGYGKLAWEGATRELVKVEYAACEWVNRDLEQGVWVLQAGFLDSCAQQLIPKTQALPAKGLRCC